MTPLSSSRYHEIDICAYLRSLFAGFLDYETALESVYRYYNRLLADHNRTGISYETIMYILEYDQIERWEWITYYTLKGLTPKQIGNVMGITSRTVSNVLSRTYQQNEKTLQRWLNHRETEQDMYGMQQATQTAQLVVPSRNATSVLR